jgi:hypothetical protein
VAWRLDTRVFAVVDAADASFLWCGSRAHECHVGTRKGIFEVSPGPSTRPSQCVCAPFVHCSLLTCKLYIIVRANHALLSVEIYAREQEYFL